MNIEITTPALLFPAISLLLLAYTNRFLVLAQLIRELSSKAENADKRRKLNKQIKNLRKRVELIRWMQASGVVSFLLCTVSMFSLFLEYPNFGKIIFGISLGIMCFSLILSLIEVIISSTALNIELQSMNKRLK